jgi:hypothetical protein
MFRLATAVILYRPFLIRLCALFIVAIMPALVAGMNSSSARHYDVDGGA